MGPATSETLALENEVITSQMAQSVDLPAREESHTMVVIEEGGVSQGGSGSASAAYLHDRRAVKRWHARWTILGGESNDFTRYALNLYFVVFLLFSVSILS
jgi:hypothetical protein